MKILLAFLVLLTLILPSLSRLPTTRPKSRVVMPASRNKVTNSYYDTTINSYMTERTCWWNEPCKKEFQRVFRCRCPDWAYCRSLGRYFPAHCSFTQTGYIWEQNYTSGHRQRNHHKYKNKSRSLDKL